MTEEVLLEKKLTTDFTFGFELEAIAYGRHDFSDSRSGLAIKNFVNDRLGNGGDFHGDSSLEVNEEGDVIEYYASEDEEYYYQNGEAVDMDYIEDMGGIDEVEFRTTFEYASPVLQFNPANIQKVINFLDDGMNMHDLFYTNDTCGFHHHISFEGITGEDAAWIVSQLAMDDDAREMFAKFNDVANKEDTGIENYNFITAWSSNQYLYDLADAIRNFDFAEIKNKLNTEKYTILNVHNNKTLEWRGPRNFLQTKNRKTIVNFYKQLWKIINWMTLALDKKEINGMKKELFLKNLIIDNDFRPISNFPSFKVDKNGLMSDETVNKLVEKCQQNPTVLITLSQKKRSLDQVIQKLFNTSKLGKTLTELSEKSSIYPQVINDISYKYIPAKMAKLASEDAVYNTSKKTLERLLATRYGISKEELTDIITNLVPRMNTELFSGEDAYYLNKVIYASDFKLIPYCYEMLSDEAKKNVVDSYIGWIGQGKESNFDNIEVMIEKADEPLKSIIINKFSSLLTSYPILIKYIDNIDNLTIISIIGKAMKKGNLDDVKAIMLDSGKITKQQMAEMESYFTKYYKHDLNDEITTI